MISVGTGRRTHGFRDAVRRRDGRCWVTGEEPPSAQFGEWSGLEAAHIIPIAFLVLE
jgi:hypothetical protein